MAKNPKEEPSLDDVLQQYNFMTECAAKEEVLRRKAIEWDKEMQNAFEEDVRRVVATGKAVLTKVATNLNGGVVNDTREKIDVQEQGTPEVKGTRILELAFHHPSDVGRNNGNPRVCRLAFFTAQFVPQPRRIYLASSESVAMIGRDRNRYVAIASFHPDQLKEPGDVEKVIASNLKTLLAW